MLTVYGFNPLPTLASPSPFCLKLEAWLRLAGLPYQTAEFNPFRAPNGKAPYVRLEDGTVIADSSVIIRHLTEAHAIDLDAHLSAAQRAQATLIQRTLEDHLYYALLYFRWVDDAGFEVLKQHYFAADGWPKRALVPLIARRGVRRTTHAQGLSRHPPAEIVRQATEDLAAVSEALGGSTWMLGERPSTLDAIAYASLANLHLGPFDDALRAALRAHPNLVAYAERTHAQLWPDGAPR